MVVSTLLRTVSGFAPAVVLMALYHAAMARKDRKRGRKTAKAHIAGVYVFCFVLVLVLTITNVPGIYHLEVDSKVNLTLFAYFPAMAHQYFMNVLLFVPVGFLLPLLWKWFENFGRTLLCGFVFSLSIEIAQLFNERVTDVDDLLMNTLGTVAGFLIFTLIKKGGAGVSALSIGHSNHWRREPFVCFAFVWISVLVFKPVLSDWLLRIVFPLVTGAPG